MAESFELAQPEFLAGIVRDVVESKSSLVLSAMEDATPTAVGFGKLQSALLPHARYAHWDGTRWKALTLDAYSGC